MAASDAEVERAVRAYFEALAAGEDVSPYATGPYAQVRRVVLPRSASLDIRRLSVAERQGGRAIVDFDAVLAVQVEALDGPFEHSVEYGGPVIALREEGAWKVADYAIGGRHRSESFQPLDVSLTNGSLHLRVASLELRGDATVLNAALENRGRNAVVVTEVRRASRDVGRWWWTPVPLVDFPTVPAGETSPLRVAWSERFSLSTRAIRFAVRGGEIDGPGRFLFAFEVQRPDGRVVAIDQQIPSPSRLRATSKTAVSWSPYVVIAALIASNLNAVAAVVVGCWACVYLGILVIRARRFDWRQRWMRRWLLTNGLFGLGLLAFAAFLWSYAA